jgi:hypothetical protein
VEGAAGKPNGENFRIAAALSMAAANSPTIGDVVRATCRPVLLGSGTWINQRRFGYATIDKE